MPGGFFAYNPCVMKTLSINLWVDKYGHKTLAQLKAFAGQGYETYAATVREEDKGLVCEIYRVSFISAAGSTGGSLGPDTGSERNNKPYILNTVATEKVEKEAFGTAYFGAFRFLFDYAAENDFYIV